MVKTTPTVIHLGYLIKLTSICTTNIYLKNNSKPYLHVFGDLFSDTVRGSRITDHGFEFGVIRLLYGSGDWRVVNGVGHIQTMFLSSASTRGAWGVVVLTWIHFSQPNSKGTG